MTKANKFATALSNVAADRTLAAANVKRAQSLALIATRKNVAQMLNDANVDASRFDKRALYVSEKCVKFVAALAQEHVSSVDFEKNMFATFKTILLAQDAESDLLKSDVEACILTSAKIDASRAHIIYARKNKEMASIYLSVVPIYLMAGLFCLAIALVLQAAGYPINWFGPDHRMEWISILGLALVPTVLGHSLINWALTRIRGQAVVIINLAQFIFAGIMGYLLLDEIPALVFYIASALVVIGAVIVIRQKHNAS